MRFFSSESPDEEEEPEPSSSSPLSSLLPEPPEELLDQDPSASEPLSDFFAVFLAGDFFFAGDFGVFLIGVATGFFDTTLVSSGLGV